MEEASGSAGSAVPNQRRKNLLPNTKISSWHIFIFTVALFLALWTYLHRTLVVSDPISSVAVKHRLGQVSTENILKLQNLLDDSKVLLREIRSANTTLSAHTLNEFESVGADRSVLTEELLSLKRRHTEVERELGQCKKMRISPDASVEAEREELRSHLKECQVHLVSALDQSSRIPSSHIVEQTNAGSSPNPLNKYWLIIGIPTVSRSGNLDYLLQTLGTIRHQLPTDPSDLLYQRVKVMVVNMEGPSHKRFYEAQTMFASGHTTPDPISFNEFETSTGSRRLASEFHHGTFEFITLSDEYKATAKDFLDPKKGATADNDQGNSNVPGYRVRKQTRSVAQVLKRAKGRANYYLFLEDDMILCPHGFNSIQYLLSKSTKYAPNWLAVRASYGLNGIFIHDKDIDHFYHYLIDNQVRRPPDHLAVEWFAGESKVSGQYKGHRAHLAYRYNIFDHIGITSTLRKEKQTSFPRCYEALGKPTLFEVEAFDPRQCPSDDLWPCSLAGNRRDLDSDRAIVHWVTPRH
jgi:hypothetical protein